MVLTGKWGEAKSPEQQLRDDWAGNLRDELEAKQFTRKQFQAALREAGLDVSLQTISNWLGGATSPPPLSQAYIAHVLKAPAHRLFPIPRLAS